MERLEYLLYRSPQQSSASNVPAHSFPNAYRQCWPASLTQLMGERMPELRCFILAGDCVTIDARDLDFLGQTCAKLQVLYVASVHCRPSLLSSASSGLKNCHPFRIDASNGSTILFPSLVVISIGTTFDCFPPHLDDSSLAALFANPDSFPALKRVNILYEPRVAFGPPRFAFLANHIHKLKSLELYLNADFIPHLENAVNLTTLILHLGDRDTPYLVFPSLHRLRSIDVAHHSSQSQSSGGWRKRFSKLMFSILDGCAGKGARQAFPSLEIVTFRGKDPLRSQAWYWDIWEEEFATYGILFDVTDA